jgi:hypothetical protein
MAPRSEGADHCRDDHGWDVPIPAVESWWREAWMGWFV